MSKKPKTKSTPAKPKPKALVIGNKGVANAAFSQFVEMAAGRKIVLHIGCGAPSREKVHPTFRGDDWFELRLDIDASVKPHIVADIVDLSMIPDHSVHAVWSSHNIEHLYPHVVPVALKEINRVTAWGGHFLVTLPDIQMVANFVAHGDLEEPIYDSPAGPISPIDIMYGFRASMARGNLYMAHRTAFTAKTLAFHLREAGFSNIMVKRDWVDLWAVGYKYPVGHALRVENISIQNGQERDGVPVPPAPTPVNRTPHPGAIWSNRMTDELDVPPKMWQPLGLKHHA